MDSASGSGHSLLRTMARGRNAPRWLARHVSRQLFQWRYHARPPVFVTPADRAIWPVPLDDLYDRYVTDVSKPEMAISLELARFVYALCVNQAPRVILDLGSGFSSVVFRWYAAHDGRAVVWSVDDDPVWMAQTRQFLTRAGLTNDHMECWRSLEAGAWLAADLILYDFGSTVPRCANMPLLMQNADPQALLIVDDVHQPPIRRAAMSFIRSNRLRYTDVGPLTKDRYGRYAWMVFGFRGTR